jgi:hypothetical protein
MPFGHLLFLLPKKCPSGTCYFFCRRNALRARNPQIRSQMLYLLILEEVKSTPGAIRTPAISSNEEMPFGHATF